VLEDKKLIVYLKIKVFVGPKISYLNKFHLFPFSKNLGCYNLAPTEPFDEPQERERRHMRGRGKESSSKVLPQTTCVQLSSKGGPLYWGMGESLPPPRHPRTGGKGRDGAALGCPKTLALASPMHMGPLWPIWKA
jgi:hypothetical protein